MQLAAENIGLNLALLPGRVGVQRLSWGEGALPEGPWDVVIGSDVTYEDGGAMAALATTLHDLLLCQQPHPPRVVLAHDHRARSQPSPARWDDDDGKLRAFAVAAASRGLELERLAWERPAQNVEGGAEAAEAPAPRDGAQAELLDLACRYRDQLNAGERQEVSIMEVKVCQS